MPEINFYDRYPAARDVRVICQYCKDRAILTDSAVVYNGRSYGPIWYCSRCDAFVGCHRNSRKCKPLGTLANRELRAKRRQAHDAFDQFWRSGFGRKRLYKELADWMRIPVQKCHIGMFAVQECDQVIKFCRERKRR